MIICCIKQVPNLYTNLIKQFGGATIKTTLPKMGRITIATTFLFLIITTSSVLARPHIRPRITLADLDKDGAIPQDNVADIDRPVDEIPQDVRFEVVDLPSHFETYDKNSDGKVSLLELTIVTGTKEIDAMGPFQAADTNNDNKLSFKEFQEAPWIFGVSQEIEFLNQFAR
ncbi:uncharacterized protein LOC752806 isoform X1 [Strongylocentrotus purpuratus]|uniref:EF-hand domain-containing protein n=2 Tax=Strongylocentrotus purpuratus TaxID=7668 RepID=A0A7M7MXD9_STRPU|nr:uncharacterized protein LOC752806 isoform X1 [Strongylocentrotus purpuratus]